VVSAARAADVGKNAGVGAGLSRVVVAASFRAVSRLGELEVAGETGHGVWAAGVVVGVGLGVGGCLWRVFNVGVGRLGPKVIGRGASPGP